MKNGIIKKGKTFIKPKNKKFLEEALKNKIKGVKSIGVNALDKWK